MAFLSQDRLVLAAKITGATAIVVATVKVFNWSIYKKKRKNHPRDTVILYHPGRGPEVPSLVPFAAKLETYLRIAKIPYKTESTLDTSRKGKSPWIELNGEQYADSEFIIEMLNTKFGTNLDKSFSAEDLGVARAFQKMIEENTYWTLVADRWFFEPTKALFKVLIMPFPVRFILRRKVRNMLYAQGTGRHTEEEVYHIMDTDLKALSDFLGTKKFILGDKPCKADCSVFGLLSQAYWQSFGSKMKEIFKKYYNLCAYCERIKSVYWPDWEECVTHQKVN